MSVNSNQERIGEIRAQLAQLRCDLGDRMGVSQIGDWKIAKYQEYLLAGLDAPYDIAELHTLRQSARDQINTLEAELATLEGSNN